MPDMTTATTTATTTTLGPIPRADFNQRSTVAAALAPVLCIDCDQYVPAGWVDFIDSAKCTTGRSHRVPNYVLTHVLDLAWNATQQARWTGEDQEDPPGGRL